jgi:hypothetical protein
VLVSSPRNPSLTLKDDLDRTPSLPLGRHAATGVLIYEENRDVVTYETARLHGLLVLVSDDEKNHVPAEREKAFVRALIAYAGLEGNR